MFTPVCENNKFLHADELFVGYLIFMLQLYQLLLAIISFAN